MYCLRVCVVLSSHFGRCLLGFSLVVVVSFGVELYPLFFSFSHLFLPAGLYFNLYQKIMYTHRGYLRLRLHPPLYSTLGR